MLHTKNITKNYGDLPVLKGIDLEIQQGEVVAIVGASGAGKSTLLQILGTLDKADSGDLYIADQHINQLNAFELARFRNQQIGFVFQFHNLMGEFTALENVLMPAWIGNNRISKNQENRAKELLERLGMASRLSHLPSQLSGGEAQRVAVARALMNAPSVVFADEPSGNLDSRNAEELHNLFFDLRQELNQTFVIVTHNEALAARADIKLTMQDGRIDEHRELLG